MSWRRDVTAFFLVPFFIECGKVRRTSTGVMQDVSFLVSFLRHVHTSYPPPSPWRQRRANIALNNLRHTDICYENDDLDLKANGFVLLELSNVILRSACTYVTGIVWTYAYAHTSRESRVETQNSRAGRIVLECAVEHLYSIVHTVRTVRRVHRILSLVAELQCMSIGNDWNWLCTVNTGQNEETLSLRY